MILGQRIRLDPNNVQASFFDRCAGAARFTYNLGLARWQELHKAGEKPNWRSINAEINARKADDLVWMKEIPWAVPNNALQNLGNAFSHFFRRVKAGDKPGYPKFKKRGRCQESFAIEGRALQFDRRKVKIPKLGWVRTRQELRFPGKVLAARFTKRAGHWYLSIQVEVADSFVYPHRCETQAAVGIDVGVRDLAVLSTGEKIEAPRVLRKYEDKLRKLNKELSRRTKGGKNWKRTATKLARLYERIANIRQAVTHELTASIVQRFRRIGVEDLNVKGMAQGLRLGKSVMDAAMGELLRQIDYKATLAGSVVIKADRWFPSSKTCHVCGVVLRILPRSFREWWCVDCDTLHDRDVNAAKNLEIMAQLSPTVALTGIAQRLGSTGSEVIALGTKLPTGWEPGVAADLG